MKGWLAKHRKFDVLDRMAEQMRTEDVKFCLMPLMTDTQWAMMHRFIRPDGEVSLGLILCDRESMPQMEFIQCCVAGATDLGAIIEPKILGDRSSN